MIKFIKFIFYKSMYYYKFQQLEGFKFFIKNGILSKPVYATFKKQFNKQIIDDVNNLWIYSFIVENEGNIYWFSRGCDCCFLGINGRKLYVKFDFETIFTYFDLNVLYEKDFQDFDHNCYFNLNNNIVRLNGLHGYNSAKNAKFFWKSRMLF